VYQSLFVVTRGEISLKKTAYHASHNALLDKNVKYVIQAQMEGSQGLVQPTSESHNSCCCSVIYITITSASRLMRNYCYSVCTPTDLQQ
jgi:hypothetical protein